MPASSSWCRRTRFSAGTTATSTWDLGQIAPIAARNNPAQPALVLCAHDGDNAWSGGYSYYNQWVSQMASTAVSDGYEPTTIEQFISDFPPPTNDIVHVEDGGWVFADSDFGSPSFINWNWPPSYTDSSGANVVDPSIGVTSKGDNWRVIIATENRVETAQQISGISPEHRSGARPGQFFRRAQRGRTRLALLRWLALTAVSFITAAPETNVCGPSSRNPMPAGMSIRSSPPTQAPTPRRRRYFCRNGTRGIPGGTNYRRAIRLQNGCRNEFRFLGLDLCLRRFRHHKRQSAAAGRRHKSAGERPVQDLRRRPVHWGVADQPT